MNALSILTQIAPRPWTANSVELHVPINVETPSRADFTLSHAGANIHTRFEFHEHESDVWTIRVRATDGSVLELSDGGETLRINDVSVPSHQNLTEYQCVYRRFSELIRAKVSDCDLRPLHLIDQIFSTASIRSTSAVSI